LKTLRATLLALALVVTSTPAALAANELPGVGPVALAGDSGGATLAVPGLAGAAYRVQWLSNPWRLAVDLRGHWLGAPESSIWLGQGLVTRIRASRHGGGLTRIVFDLQAPADLRTENRGGALVLIVVPRRMAAAPAYAPPPYAPPYGVPYAPPQAVAMPTPRPVPMYPAYSGYAPYQGYMAPAPRVTPLPVMPPGMWAQPGPPAMTYPAPQAVPQASAVPLPAYPPSAPPVAMAPPQVPPMAPPPVSMPVSGVPGPGDDDPFSDEAVVQPKSFFGSRAYLAPGLAVGVSETYEPGNAKISAGTAPNVEVGVDHMFTPMFGLHGGLRMLGYSFADDELGAEVNRRHTRDELELRLGGRARFDVGAGVEVYAQPQFALRNVSVGTTLAGVAPVDGFSKFDEYVSTSHLGYGGGLGIGVGYPFNETFGLALTGEANYLLGGSGKAAPIYPLLNVGGGLEARMNFGGFGVCLGYKLGMLNGGNDYSWLTHGPALSLGYNY
jgi:hypothetical protein